MVYDYHNQFEDIKMTQSITTKNFSIKLSAFKTSMNTQRDNLQDLIVFGICHYGEHGSTVYLTKVLNTCIGVKALPTKAIKDFIKDHANVVWSKNKDGDMVFKKQGKEIEATIPTIKWYESSHVKKDQAKPDMDVVARMKSLLTQLDKAMKNHGIKEGQEDIANKLRYDLANLLEA